MNFFSYFHLYGLIVGIAMVIGLLLIEKKAKQYNLVHDIEKISLYTIICGIIGARLWHVVTDFHLYQNSLHEILFIWQGGLSILGGIVGGIFALYGYAKVKQINLLLLLDICVFGVPFSQAIGRLGNYVNQELYGLPTNLAWKIFIDPKYRNNSYQEFSWYHPLFLYELILTAIFGLWVWLFDKNQQNILGKGWYFHLYIFYYAVTRLLLEFLRIDKSLFLDSMFGVNQLLLLVVAVYSSRQLFKRYEQTK